MTWARIEETAPLHPKHVRAGMTAFGFWTAALCYCNRHLTDGVLTPKEVSMVWPSLHHRTRHSVLKALVANGQFTEESNGAYRVHDFLDFNPSKQEVIARRHATKARKERFEERVRNAVPEPHKNASRTPFGTPLRTRPRPDPLLTTKAFVVKEPPKEDDPLDPPFDGDASAFIAAEARKLKEQFAVSAAREQP